MIPVFIGRTEELRSLNNYYNSDKFECAVIYGRRRVGKTELINEFVKDKKHVFFTAVEGTYKRNLDNLSKSIISGLEGNVRISSPKFSEFSDCLDYLHHNSHEKLVVVFDEYPYFAQSEKSVSSVLQQYIDHHFQKTDIMFILCGSSMSFMETQIMGSKSPLYGRRTCQYKILPFDFSTSMLFHSSFTKQEKAIIYAITGGIPKYLLQFDDKKSLRDNIAESFFSPGSLFFEEPNNLLKQELREPAVYNSIITAIASGSSKLSEIATKSYLSTSTCSNYLTSLIALNIVKKNLPVLAQPNAKNTLYRLNDGMFRFWYRFVYDNVSEISMYKGDFVYEQIEPFIPDFMGEAFEDICIQWLWRENFEGRLPFSFKDCGRWWGTNPIYRAQREIDILAHGKDRESAIFCECKWRNEKVSAGTINDLVDRSVMFNYNAKYYFVFSKSGFTTGAKAMASENVRLIDFDDMF